MASFTYTVDDNAGATSNVVTVSLAVSAANDPPVITSTPVTTATENAAYTYTVTATDRDADDVLTFSLTTAPSGMTIGSSSGVIDWTPTDAQTGPNPVVAEVTDDAGVPLTDTQSFTVTVNAAPTVAITAPADGSSTIEGQPVAFSGTATDAEDGDLTASLVWTSSLDGSIGTGGSFSTSTLSVGTHAITAQVTNSLGVSGSDVITLTVTLGPVPCWRSPGAGDIL